MTESIRALHWARLREDPDDRAAFEILEEHLFMEADWSALADLYQLRQAAPSLAGRPRMRAELAIRRGQVCEDRLDDADAAIRSYTEAVQLDPSQRRALRKLRRIYAHKRSWEAVIQIGEREISLAESGEERARIYSEMGDVWQRELDDPAQAQELYARARAETGTASAALPEPDSAGSSVQSAWLAAARGDTASALDALERALDRDPGDVDALDMALTVLEGAERHAEMPALLERRATLAADAETRSTVLMRLGEILELTGDADEARDAYERALAARPEHADARDALIRIYRASEAWSPLRAMLEAAARDADDESRVDLLVELADVLAVELDDPEAARDSLQQALALAPDDPRLQAANARLDEDPVALTMPELDGEPAVGEQRATRIVGVLERKLAAREAEGEGLSADAIGLRLRIAELHSGAQGETPAAVEVLEPALVDDAALLGVAPMLAGLYEQLGRMEPLISLAERAAAGCEEAGPRAFWRRRAAEAARAIGDADRALASLRALIEEFPRDRAARRALIELHRSRGEAEPLRELLCGELAFADAEREGEIQAELAALSADPLGDRAGALAHLRRCLELEPARGDLLEQALGACAGGDPLAQLDLIEHTALHATRDVDRAALLARRGALLADALAWQDEAVMSFEAALALDPEQPLARERLAAGAGG